MQLSSKLKLTTFLATLGLLLSATVVGAAPPPPTPTPIPACIPETRACGQGDVCCGFPDIICHTTGVHKNYCWQSNITCGRPTQPCCDSPNPPCADGFGCSGGSCPAAESCFINATARGGGAFGFEGACPTHYRDDWDVFVDTLNLATGSGENVSANGGPYAAGSHTVLLRCYGYYGADQVRSTECSDTFTSTGPTPTPTPPGGVTPTPTPPSGGPCSGTDIPTGLGCIPTDPTGLVNKILQIAIGVSSGIALLLLISGAFKVLTSSGDPKAVMSGKETITSAIAGLLLILLSVAILNIIGIKILGIPIWKTSP